MTKPTFDKESEAYKEYQWAVAQVTANEYNGSLTLDTTDFDGFTEEDENIQTELQLSEFSVEKKQNSSSLTMKNNEEEITIKWDGDRLSASRFDIALQDQDKMEVPKAIKAINGVLKDHFDYSLDQPEDYYGRLADPTVNDALIFRGDQQISTGETDYDDEGHDIEGDLDGETLPDDYISDDEGNPSEYLPEEEEDIKEDRRWGDD